ncbi:MAG: sodium/solute symporter [Opitutaceae bacterium]|nr:sodium/solute symporter [Opitutaceae bacterium]
MRLNLSSLDLAVFLAYFLAVGILAYLASRSRGATRRDYFLGGDKLPWWMIGGSIVAANISSHHFIGVMGVAYHRGFVAVTGEWGAIWIGFNALLWIFLPFYLRNGFFTMPEFLQRRYGSSARGMFAGLILLIYVFVEIAAVLYFGALALNALIGVSVHVCVLIIAVVTAIYTIAGGLRAVVWTEMLQLVVLVGGGIVLTAATLRASGGWSAFFATSKDWDILLPADDRDFPWTMLLGGSICISVFYCAANQFIVQRVLAAKSEWDARMGVVFTQYLKFLLPLIIVVPGLLGPRLFPGLEKPDLIFPTLVANLLPSGLVGLVLAGLVAAVMSHVSGALNSSTTILTVDVYQVFRPKATERDAVRFGRWSCAVLALIGMATAELLTQHSKKPVFLYLLNAYGFVTPGMATMFLVGIFWRGATQAGALTAGILTIVLSGAFTVFYPTMPFYNRTGIVFWTCVVACVVVSRFTKRQSDAALAGLIWNRASMRLPAGGPTLRLWQRPGLWWAGIMATVLYFYVRYA